ncbi:Hypothetical predicted protein, partial [Mytilus galloprovincialis]
PRNQINQRTSFLDLSVAYGNTLSGQADLRENGTVKKRWKITNGYSSPTRPQVICKRASTCRFAHTNRNDVMSHLREEDEVWITAFVPNLSSGDNRPAEVPMFTVIHIIFLREHNNIEERLRSLGYSDGEQLYQEAKKILTGIYQHIIYTEYLPVILGDQGMDMFGLRSTPSGFNTQYNPSINAANRNSFEAAAYRFGHSFVGS